MWARRPEVLEAYVAAGATMARSLGELGAACDRVAVCVTTDADIRAVVLADDGLLPAMRSGSSLAVHSTAHPDLVREVEAAGCRRWSAGTVTAVAARRPSNLQLSVVCVAVSGPGLPNANGWSRSGSVSTAPH